MNELAGPFTNSNYFAGYLVIIILLGVGVIINQRTLSKKVILGYILLVMFTAFTLTLSRAGWASMIISFITIGILFILRRVTLNLYGVTIGLLRSVTMVSMPARK